MRPFLACLLLSLLLLPSRGAAGDFPHAVYLPLVASPAADMILIPAGPFQMGCHHKHNGDFACPDPEAPLHAVTLAAYWIDRAEVTNAAYAACVAAGACLAPHSGASATRPAYYGNPIYSAYPVVWVDWYQAAAYCAWAGRRLPTEAEWEKAARGAAVIAYPWGDDPPTCALANHASCLGDTAPAGSYPTGASSYGVLDLAGSVWEWVADWWQADYYWTSPPVDPSGPASGDAKIVRGGGWSSSPYILRVSYRDPETPDSSYNLLGFRCAKTP